MTDHLKPREGASLAVGPGETLGDYLARTGVRPGSLYAELRTALYEQLTGRSGPPNTKADPEPCTELLHHEDEERQRFAERAADFDATAAMLGATFAKVYESLANADPPAEPAPASFFGLDRSLPMGGDLSGTQPYAPQYFRNVALDARDRALAAMGRRVQSGPRSLSRPGALEEWRKVKRAHNDEQKRWNSLDKIGIHREWCLQPGNVWCSSPHTDGTVECLECGARGQPSDIYYQEPPA